MKKALIIGVTGQDGSYLSEILLKKGYKVHGLMRRSSTFPTDRVDHLYAGINVETNFYMHYGDLSDGSGLTELVLRLSPDFVFNLGAQSHVRVSFDLPVYTADIDGLGVLRVLEAVRTANRILGKSIKFYQASSSEMFGQVQEIPQNENTPFHPRSPYGCAKVYGYWQTVNYREAYNMFACNGILFNHESPRRLETFVTRKITRALTRIKLGLQDKLYLGNIETKRDWGHAREFCEAMLLMLEQDSPDDYVIATGETHSVRDFLEETASVLGIKRWQQHIELDNKYFRPSEVDLLVGDYSKAKRVLGWEPKVTFKELIKEMVDNDYRLALLEKQFGDKSLINANIESHEKMTR